MTRIGIVGLGSMGSGIAHNLLKKRYPLHVFARQSAAVAPFVQAGAQAFSSAAAMARDCDLVFLSLSDAAAVEAVLFGEEGLAQGLRPGSCVVDTSTIAVTSARKFGERLQETGFSFLDAPVSDGQAGAQAGTLGCMVGGPADVIDDCREVMGAFCKTITRVGDLGAGQTVKACNQVAVVGALLGVADAMALASAQGVDPAPMRKDMQIALDTARAPGAVLPIAALAEQMLDAPCESGRPDVDWCAIALEPQRKEPS